MRKLYTKLTTSVLTRAFLSNQSKKSQARCSLASHIYKPQISCIDPFQMLRNMGAHFVL